MRVRPMVLGALMLALGAGVATGQEKDKKPKRDRNLITHEEIEKSGGKNALQVVRSLRPMWLSNRGGGMVPGVAGKDEAIGVFVDGVRRGKGIRDLEDVAIEQVEEIRFYSVEAAVSKFGPDNPHGAIEAISKK